MTPTSKNARIAGFLYLLLTIVAPYRLHEVAFMLWLLIKGAKEQTVSAPAA